MAAPRSREDEGEVNAWVPLRASKAMAIGPFIVLSIDTFMVNDVIGNWKLEVGCA